jgi:hypothetical protein
MEQEDIMLSKQTPRQKDNIHDLIHMWYMFKNVHLIELKSRMMVTRSRGRRGGTLSQ